MLDDPYHDYRIVMEPIGGGADLAYRIYDVFYDESGEIFWWEYCDRFDAWLNPDCFRDALTLALRAFDKPFLTFVDGKLEASAVEPGDGRHANA